MFLKLSVSILFLSLGFPALASDRPIFLDLKTDNFSDYRFINYPGRLSGICGLEIVSSEDLSISQSQKEELAEKLIIIDNSTRLKAVVTEEDVTWYLISTGLFMTKIEVKAVDGDTLRSVVESVLGQTEATVYLAKKECESKAP